MVVLKDPGDFLGELSCGFFGDFRGEPPEGCCTGDLPGDLFGDTPGDLSDDSDFTGEFSADETGDMRTSVRARIKLIASERACVFCLFEGVVLFST